MGTLLVRGAFDILAFKYFYEHLVNGTLKCSGNRMVPFGVAAR